jgi:hypothetical protein
MKQYIETKDCSFTFEGMSIPNAEGNRHFRMMNEEVIANEATITPYDKAAGLLEDKIASERSWRDSELRAMDIEIRKAWQDEALTLSINTYSELLREWPSTDDFPETRPTL